MEDELNPLYRAADGKYGAEYDITQLRQGGHGRTVHRDYLAHCLRWGWVSRVIRYGEKILDAGCGQDVSLYDVLAGTQSFTDKEDRPGGHERPIYVGVDLNKITKKCGAKWAYVQGGVNIAEGDVDLPHWGDFDRVVSFEVIEHMSVSNGDKYLARLHEALRDGGALHLSTPVFNGKAAKNHIHEYDLEELYRKLENAGFELVQRHGTFMSWQDMRRVVTSEEFQLAEKLRPFLGPEVIACLLAPLYPDASRNNVWTCVKR